MKTPLRAVGYARYSSDNQRDESIDAQVRAIKDYASSKGIQIINFYIDRAKTATSDNRPQFKQMIEDAKLRNFNCVIVHKLDRFSRERYDSAHYKKILKQREVSVYSVLEHLDGSPESIILESVLIGMAEYYSANLAREVMKGMHENALQCKHTGGTPLLGYSVDPGTKKYIINAPEAVAVKMIFTMYIDGHGYNSIIRALNERGYKTKRGMPFGKNSIHELLINEKYAGVYTFNKRTSKSPKRDYGEDTIRIVDGMPAIVNKEDFDKVQLIMSTHKHKNARHKAKESYLLSGLIYCGECNYAMVGNVKYSGPSKTKYVTYRCSLRDLKKSCTNKEIRKDYLEIFELEAKKETVTVSEETLRKLFHNFHKFVNEKNQVELKKFVEHYVEKVLVYEDNVKVVFRFYIIVVLIGGGEGYLSKSSSNKTFSIETFWDNQYLSPFTIS